MEGICKTLCENFNNVFVKPWPMKYVLCLTKILGHSGNSITGTTGHLG